MSIGKYTSKTHHCPCGLLAYYACLQHCACCSPLIDAVYIGSLVPPEATESWHFLRKKALVLKRMLGIKVQPVACRNMHRLDSFPELLLFSLLVWHSGKMLDCPTNTKLDSWVGLALRGVDAPMATDANTGRIDRNS